jgi:hypothetical protein
MVNLLGRKLTFSLLVLFVTTLLLVNRFLDGETFVDVIQMLIIVYPCGSISQKYLLATLPATSTIIYVPDNKKDSFILIVYCVVVFLLWKGDISELIYRNLTVLVCTIFITGNVVDKISDTKTSQ